MEAVVRAALAFAVMAVVGVTGPAAAGAQVSVGAHGIYDADAEVYGFGPRVDVDVDDPGRLSFVASLDHFRPEEGGLWGLNANLRYSILGSGSPVAPYLGAGYSYRNESEEEEFRDLPGGGGIWISPEKSMSGLNLLGGLEFRVSESLTPFTQVRYTTSGEGHLMLTGGLLLF